MASTSLIARRPLLAQLAEQSLAMRAMVVLLGSIVLAASSWIQVPMYPVPMTMQSCAILLVGALCGRRLAAETVGAFLLEAAIGLPVLAGGAGGLHHFWGPTAGYLFGYLVAATVIGWLVERGFARNLPKLVVAMLVGEVAIFGLGCLWLGAMFGTKVAIVSGLLPFLLGDAVKTAFAAAVATGIGQFRQPRR